MVRWLQMLVAIAALGISTTSGYAQEVSIIQQFFIDLKVVQSESAEARKVRLEFINQERDRIRAEICRADQQLGNLQQIVPDELRPKVLRDQAEKARENQQRDFDANLVKVVFRGNAAEIMRGKPLTNMVLVLGPVANYRKRIAARNAPGPGANLMVTSDDATHFRLAPATTAGGPVEVRLNRRPLEMDWPTITRQRFPSECKTIEKMRDLFEGSLSAPDKNETALADQADAVDEAAYRLMTLIYKERSLAVSVGGPREVQKRVDLHRQLTAAIRHLERFRATVNRFKLVPAESKVRVFAGGNIEDFLDFCYSGCYSFQEAAPADEAAYGELFNKMKAYGHDVQLVKDMKIDILARIQELEVFDRQLVMEGAVNKN